MLFANSGFSWHRLLRNSANLSAIAPFSVPHSNRQNGIDKHRYKVRNFNGCSIYRPNILYNKPAKKICL